MSLNAVGHNPRWEDCSLARDANWKVENKVIEFTGLDLLSLQKAGWQQQLTVESCLR